MTTLGDVVPFFLSATKAALPPGRAMVVRFKSIDGGAGRISESNSFSLSQETISTSRPSVMPRRLRWRKTHSVARSTGTKSLVGQVWRPATDRPGARRQNPDRAIRSRRKLEAPYRLLGRRIKRRQAMLEHRGLAVGIHEKARLRCPRGSKCWAASWPMVVTWSGLRDRPTRPPRCLSGSSSRPRECGEVFR